MQARRFGGVFTGFSIAADFERGMARRMMLATPHRTAIIVGYAMTALVRVWWSGPWSPRSPSSSAA